METFITNFCHHKIFGVPILNYSSYPNDFRINFVCDLGTEKVVPAEQIALQKLGFVFPMCGFSTLTRAIQKGREK